MRGQTAAAARKRTRPAGKSARYRDETTPVVAAASDDDGMMHTDDDDADALPAHAARSSPAKRARTTPAAAAATAAATTRSHDDAMIRRQQMKDAFQPWVMQTYGDAAKTKTISRRKSERIARILRGEDRSNGADSSKFRFWVRAKGFRLGPPPPSTTPTPDAAPAGDADDLYVVTSTVKDEVTGEDRPVYKKVAVVEDFFDIIYREHVEFMNNGQQQTGTAAQSGGGGGGGSPAAAGRAPPGKHAGQKRTYRAITEIYAFLPREAVTRFLMQCAECQRRGGSATTGTNGHIAPATHPASPPPPATQLGSPGVTVGIGSQLLPPSGVSPGSPTPPASPANAPPSVPKPHVHPPALLLPPTPPQQQQQHQYHQLYHHRHYYQRPSTPAPIPFDLASEGVDLSLPLTSTLLKRAALAGVSHQQLLGLDRAESSFCSSSPSPPGMTAGRHDEGTKRSTSPLSHDYAMSDGAISLDLSAKAEPDEHSPGKDEDDEDDDDVEDRIDTQGHDPERLKAFNMFVRLFVDENLDRMVPISRQPREKVQAIIDSCVRQFPEFGERARKRIRTYLKSCRRHKRPRDASSDAAPASGASSLAPVSNRPMPPHLTSAAAEHILAQACENENQNAKRLRLGLEPISQPMPTNAGEQQGAIATSQTSPVNLQTDTQSSTSSTANLFRPAFGPYQRTTGPTDLSTKPRPSVSNGVPTRTSPIPHKLTPAEILAVRQLVTGYRESAAFLLRSADELEQLLQQQNASL